MSPIMDDCLPVLASFLRKNQRALKLSTLVLLETLVANYHQIMKPNSLDSVLIELPPLLSEADLHIAQLAMNLLTSTARLQKNCLPLVEKTSLPEVLKLAQSPLLQGAAQVSKTETHLSQVMSFDESIFRFPCFSFSALSLKPKFPT